MNETVETISRMSKQGYSLEQIAESIGIDKNSTYRMGKYYGIDIVGNYKKFRNKKAKMLYQKGMTIPEIAKELGISSFTVESILSNGGRVKGKRAYINTEKVKKLYLEGNSINKICELVNTKSANVIRILRNENILPTQREIYDMHVSGMTNDEIAVKTGFSARGIQRIVFCEKKKFDPVYQAKEQKKKNEYEERLRQIDEEEERVKSLIPKKKPIVFKRVKENGKVYADVSALYGI